MFAVDGLPEKRDRGGWISEWSVKRDGGVRWPAALVSECLHEGKDLLRINGFVTQDEDERVHARIRNHFRMLAQHPFYQPVHTAKDIGQQRRQKSRTE